MKKSTIFDSSSIDFKKFKYATKDSFNFIEHTLIGFTTKDKRYGCFARSVLLREKCMLFYINTISPWLYEYNCFRLCISENGDIVVIKNIWLGKDATYCFVKNEDVPKYFSKKVIELQKSTIYGLNRIRTKREKGKKKFRESKKRYWRKSKDG